MTYRPQQEVSDKQAELYWHYIGHVEEHGFQPTMTEAAIHFGITRRAIHDRLSLLSLKKIIKLPDISQERCIKLLDLRFEPVRDDEAMDALTKTALLTEGMAIVREYVIEKVAENGFQPSFIEMGVDLNLSTVGVSERVRLLVDRGFVEYHRPLRMNAKNRAQIAERALKIKFVTYKAVFTKDTRNG